MNSLDKQYQDLLQDILDNGVKKETRNGGTKSIFGYTIRHNMSEGFPLLTTKKMAWKTMVTELLWFLRGDTNIKFLVDNDCHIWDGDAYQNYCKKVIREKEIVRYLKSYSTDTDGVPTIELYSKDEFIERVKTDDEFAKKWGELGPIYGAQWRQWSAGSLEDKHGFGKIDQIANLINDLKDNPDSRRLLVSAWAVHDLPKMTLPPCHYGFQVYTRELSLEERLELASKTYDVFDPLDFGIPAKVDHDEIDKMYPVPKRAISLMYNARSQDVPLGTPFNLASYGLLLMILAKEVNMVPEELITNMGDCHIYLNQIDGVREQLTREPFELPTLNPFPTYEGSRPSIESYTIGDFTLKNYKSHPSIKMPLSN
jgi:thymidylate synthase